jgi:hypothetical protein
MRHHASRAKLFCLAAVVTAVTALGLASVASAHTGIYARFNQCPSTNKEVFKCLQAVTNGGKIVLGKKTVPIVNPTTVQGGYSEGEEKEEHFYNRFFGAVNGETLSKTPQPVPGGLTGLVNCKEISLGWLRASCESIFENGLTGVNATLELARPASEIIVSEENLAFGDGLAFRLPVKVHLENPLLGSGCYIGSSSSPIIWNLTTGTTKPPAPNKPISGTPGNLNFLEGGFVTEFEKTNLVDNAWSAPGASGCGGWPAEYILDPIINASVGVPAAAGTNTSILENTRITVSQATVVNEH